MLQRGGKLMEKWWKSAVAKGLRGSMGPMFNIRENNLFSIFYIVFKKNNRNSCRLSISLEDLIMNG